MSDPQLPIPPTYADPVIVDATGKRASFNPIWLNWFLTFSNLLKQIATGVFTSHESLANLLGGTTSQHYHLTLAQYTTATNGPSIPLTAVTTPASGGVWQNTTGYNVLVTCTGGGTDTYDLSRDNVTFVPLGKLFLIPVVRGDYLRVTYVVAPTLRYFAM